MRRVLPFLPFLLLAGCTGADRSPEPPPARPRYCTRTLGRAECWANPEALPGPPREIADGPRTLTPAQEADRTRLRLRW